jgi:hypothetical protein
VVRCQVLHQHEGHARFGVAGMPEKKASNAASPPAEAPIPTIGKEAVEGVSAAAELAGASGTSNDGELAFFFRCPGVILSPRRLAGALRRPFYAIRRAGGLLSLLIGFLPRGGAVHAFWQVVTGAILSPRQGVATALLTRRPPYRHSIR